MITSALAYLLTLFMAFTIIPLLAFLLRMVSIMVLSKFYWSISRDKSPVRVLKFSIKLAQPVGFFTAIFHGYAALWMGTVFLRGMQGDSAVDLFLSIFLGLAFLLFGIRRLKNPAELKVENKIELKDGEQTLILNPDEESENFDEDPMKTLNRKLQEQFKENAQEFMQGNTVIGLIGKITGVALASMSLIPLPY
ncbi:MAG: hypothetical protein MK207_00275 [Saprospiraceae bacterium]|nr:hypothetical protein [Saprospiraceae bacterium]